MLSQYQLPEHSLTDDVATVKRAIELVGGPFASNATLSSRLVSLGCFLAFFHLQLVTGFFYL